MYESFFGLRERPFQLTPNPRFLFLSPAHREALATLCCGLGASAGVTVLLGEAGTGKTTLVRAALKAEQWPNNRHLMLSNPTLTRAEFYEMLTAGFDVVSSSGSKARFLIEFERDALDRQRQGGVNTLIIDDAQSLTAELFEEVRFLADLETETAKLLNVILVGTQELGTRLEEPQLKQLRQRVALRSTLTPMDLQETADYIAARLSVAGVDASDIFTKDAVLAVFEASHGIPRTIGVICDNALLGGFAAQIKPIDRPIVVDVCRDFAFPLNGLTPQERVAVLELPDVEDGVDVFGAVARTAPNGTTLVN
ncbi:MAG: ExeA family protein [Vicinamibacterales bacterium]